MKFTRACLVAPRKFGFFEVDEEPGEGQVLLKIASCGLCNWELNFWDGNMKLGEYPMKLGHEFAGEVVKLGPGVKRLKVGDHVSAIPDGLNFGGFAQYRVTSEKECQLLAPGIDPVYALGEPQKCVMTVLRATAAEPGDFGVVLGVGPMGMWCVQALAGKSLAGLIAIDINDAKLAMAKQFGATHVINSKNEDAQARIREITDGHMADFVIEGTGINAVFNAAQDYLRAGRGRLILMSSHHDSGEFDFRKAIDLCAEIIVPHPGFSQDPWDDFRRTVQLINNGTFVTKPLVTHEFKLSEIEKAFDMLEHKPTGFNKGIVIPD